MTSIGGYAFSGCSGLTSIELPSSVTSIGWSAFYGCSGLMSITLSSGLTRIDWYAFYGCSRLTSIELPCGLMSIGNGVFDGCSGLTSIELPSGLTSIEEDAFNKCSDSLKFIVEEDSYAMKYVMENGLLYEVRKKSSNPEQTTTEQRTQHAATEQTTTETTESQTETTEAAKSGATTELAKTVTIPARPSLKSVTNKASKKLTAKWKKVSGAEGYEVSIATKKNFKSGKKVKLTKKTTYTFTKLKKGKTYYVRVRAYRTSDGDKLYGTYSAVKKLKIKK